MRRNSFSFTGSRWPSVVFGVCLCLAAFSTMFLWPAREIPAELKGRKVQERYIAQVVSQLLERDHLSKRPLDDEISRRALAMYIKMLDPLKLYFLKLDVDGFQKDAVKIDDLVKRGDLSIAYIIFDRYMERLDQRVNEIPNLLALDHDYTINEQIATDPDDVDYATSIDELQDRWRRRIKYELMIRRADKREDDAEKGQSDQPGENNEAPDNEPSESESPKDDAAENGAADSTTSEQQTIEKITRRYESFANRRRQTDSDELLEMFLTAISSSFDPHTTYMSPDSLENFHINMKLNLEGIGAALQIVDGYTVVTKIIPGGAADKSGHLKPEDRIVSVGQGQKGEMEDIIDMKLSDVVKKIRGKAGTVVRLGVMPAGSTETDVWNITRARIELKDAEARGEIIEEQFGQDGPIYKIGVIDLPSFYMDMSGARRHLANFKSTTRDVARIIEDFKEQDVTAILLDLRRNGGGSLTEAINLTGLFIDQGPVVQVKDPAGRIQYYNDHEPGMAWDGPLVVLISKFSASASEILAGAIQDYHRGLVVGDEATHGKGTVQSLLDLGSQIFRESTSPNWGALKITMQQFYRPKGESTQKRGVLADIPIPSLTSQMDVGEADLDYAVDFDQIKAAPFSQLEMVSHDIINELRARSTARQGTSDDFQKLLRNIRKYREQKEQKFVTLNEEKFLAQRKEWDSEKEEKQQFKEQFEIDHPVFQRDYYTDEVISITVDYLRLLQRGDVGRLTERKVSQRPLEPNSLPSPAQ